MRLGLQLQRVSGSGRLRQIQVCVGVLWLASSFELWAWSAMGYICSKMTSVYDAWCGVCMRRW
jgi:hypothetical protein